MSQYGTLRPSLGNPPKEGRWEGKCANEPLSLSRSELEDSEVPCSHLIDPFS